MEITIDDLVRKCRNEAAEFEKTNPHAASIIREIEGYIIAMDIQKHTMTDYTTRIVAMANERGWSQNINHTLFKLMLEVGEFCKAVEDYRLVEAQTHKITPETIKMVDIMKQRIMKESGDIHFMHFQALRTLNLSPEACLEYTINENKKKKKKTIDEHGNPVMK